MCLNSAYQRPINMFCVMSMCLQGNIKDVLKNIILSMSILWIRGLNNVLKKLLKIFMKWLLNKNKLHYKLHNNCGLI